MSLQETNLASYVAHDLTVHYGLTVEELIIRELPLWRVQVKARVRRAFALRPDEIVCVMKMGCPLRESTGAGIATHIAVQTGLR